MKIIAFLAFRDMVRDRKIVMLVIFLLAFSYINLTFFPAFLNGLSDTFQNEVIDTGTSHIIIQPSSDSKQLYLNHEGSIRKKIDLIPGIVGTSSQISMSGTAFFEGKEMGMRIIALQPSDDRYVTAIQQKILKGEFFSDNGIDEIVLGEMIAGRKLEDKISDSNAFGAAFEGLGGIEPGQKIKVKFNNGVEKEFRVKGVVGSPGFSYVSQTSYVSKKTADEILDIDDKASAILVRLNDKKQADKYKKEILELGIPSADIQTWSEASTFTEGINQTFGVVIFVTTFVGVVIVMSTIGIVIFINTSRKKRIIGVLKAIGMQKSQITKIFLFESLFFGVIGTAIGLIIVEIVIAFLNANPIVLPLGMLRPYLPIETTINSVIILIASSIIAGFVPARMASKSDVLDSIKAVE